MSSISSLIQENDNEIRNKTVTNRIDNVKEADLHANIINNLQCDWNQTNSNDAQFIKNKPNHSVTLLEGSINVGDVRGLPTGPLSVTGDITSATKDNSTGQSRIIVAFPSIGTSKYFINFFVTVSNAVQSLLLCPVFYQLQSNGFRVEMDESGSVVQNNCTLFIKITSFNG
ncbi:hypothetical protein [uncultured Mediterranean phage uvMED]|nr:hypothetical protein [uncultured Mediterranean phage uvMED]